MAQFPIPEIAGIPEKQSSKKGQFGVALEPEIIRICGYALLVGLVAGFVAEGLLELIQLFTNIFFTDDSPSPTAILRTTTLGCGSS